MPNTSNSHKPRYAQVADDLRAAIASGELKIGDRLPSIRDLRERYGFAQMTIRHALDILHEEGLISLHQGTGSFVQTTPPPASSVEQRVNELAARYESLERRVLQLESHVPNLTTSEEDPP